MGFFSGIGDAIGGLLGKGSVIGGLLGTLSPWASVIGTVLGTTMQGSAAADAAQKQRDWQTEMSNTAYQRATADMISAGLNPGLAYSQGGASTPSGAVAEVPDYTKAATTGVSTALEAMRTKADIENTGADTALKLANISAASATAANQRAQALETGQRMLGHRSEAEWNAEHPGVVGWGRWINNLTGGLTGGTSAVGAAARGVGKTAHAIRAHRGAARVPRTVNFLSHFGGP